MSDSDSELSAAFNHLNFWKVEVPHNKCPLCFPFPELDNSSEWTLSRPAPPLSLDEKKDLCRLLQGNPSDERNAAEEELEYRLRVIPLYNRWVKYARSLSCLGENKGKYFCPYCPDEWFNGALFLYHLRDEHGDKEAERLLCEDSGAGSSGSKNDEEVSESGLNSVKSDENPTHKLDDSKAAVEEVTEAGLKSTENVTQDGKVLCPLCDDVFYYMDDFMEHLRKHDSPAEIICPFCHREFEWKMVFLYHLHEAHETPLDLKLDVESSSRQHVRLTKPGSVDGVYSLDITMTTKRR